MNRNEVLPVLYDLAVTIGGEISLQPLLVRTLQRLLYYTSFPAGFICLDLPASSGTDAQVSAHIDAAVGDYQLLGMVAQVVDLPRALLYGDAARETDSAVLLSVLGKLHTRYQSYLRLPIDGCGVLILLATEVPQTGLPLTQVFQPVMAHLAKAITLCRSYDAYTSGLLAERNLFAEVFVNSSSGVVITDPQQAIVAVNPAFSRITGYALSDVMGKTPHVLASERHDPSFYQQMWREIHSNGHWQGELWDKRSSGEEYPEWINISAVRDKTGVLTHYVGIFSDISQSKEAEAQIHQLAYFDTLTQLPNRNLFLSRLKQASFASARTGEHGAILFLDLDHFKNINDSKGLELGDQLLVEVARRVRSCTRDGDTVARLGGDEFGVLLEGLSAKATEAAKQAELIAEDIRAALSQPCELNGYTHHATGSTGIVIFLDHQEKFDDLLKYADAAMYQAKMAGRNAIRFYDPQMQAAIEARAALESELRLAIDQQQFRLHYQVQVDSLGRPIGAEALLRWVHPQRGMVSPAQFIALTEETGQIVPIGLWVLRTACAQLASWQNSALLRDMVLSVNVSAKQFRQPDFVKQVLHALRESGVKPSQLKLELTESTVLINVEATIEKMRELKLQGVSFSMDDFGTGYSSLQYLKRLPLDQIKIDQSFVRDIPQDSNDCAIVQAIIAMSGALGLNVIAEGVETDAQRAFLDQHGCHAFQGYLFSRPLPLLEFEALLTRLMS
jgi:diguanylate cyclase (GGDEF)-like protein/PAS domain S-box-containing protein